MTEPHSEVRGLGGTDLQDGAGRDGFGSDALAEQHGSDLDVFGRKLANIIMADYTQLALSAGPLDIAGQVRFELGDSCPNLN